LLSADYFSLSLPHRVGWQVLMEAAASAFLLLVFDDYCTPVIIRWGDDISSENIWGDAGTAPLADGRPGIADRIAGRCRVTPTVLIGAHHRPAVGEGIRGDDF